MTTDEMLREALDALPVKDRAWAQGWAELHGIRFKEWDTHTCQNCGHSYMVRRSPRFLMDGTVEYLPSIDPGCPKCVKVAA